MIVFMRHFLFTSSNVRNKLNIIIHPSFYCSGRLTGIVGFSLVSWPFWFWLAWSLCDTCRGSFVQLKNIFSPPPIFCRHFLFKTGTGTTPFFGAAAPGYTMATGTVYSTPARPLPRNTLSRGAFKFKKSPKHCSWKCTALVAVGIAVVLSVILSYCIGKDEGGGAASVGAF